MLYLLDGDRGTSANEEDMRYQPANGAEGEMFEAQCESCKSYREDASQQPDMPSMKAPYVFCERGILDKVLLTMYEDDGHPCFFHNDSELKEGSPATCLKRTDRLVGE